MCSPLMKNVLKPLAKRVLIPLASTAAASAADAGYQKKNFRLRTSFRLFKAKENVSNFKRRSGRYHENS